MNRRAVRAVYVAGGVSSFGTQLTTLALPWLVLQSSGSAATTGVVFAVQVLPMALLGLFGGEVLHRVGARRTMLVGDCARAPLVALVPLLYAAGALSLPALLACVALIGVCGVPYSAAQRVLAVDLIGADQRALTRANSILEAVYNITALAGPAAAGVLIAALGPQRVLWLDAVSYALSWLLLLVFVPAARPAVPPAVTSAGRRAAGVLAGLRLLRADSFLGRTAASTITYGFVLRVLALALPLLAYRYFHGDAKLGGLLVAASGAGALIGSLAGYLLATRVAAARLLALSTVLIALPLWVLALPAPPVVLVAAVALSSAAVPVSNAPYFAILSVRVPADLRAKALQAVLTLSNIAGPLGYLCSGVLIDRVGVHPTLALIAGLATLATANIVAALRRGPAVPTEAATPALAGTE